MRRFDASFLATRARRATFSGETSNVASEYSAEQAPSSLLVLGVLGLWRLDDATRRRAMQVADALRHSSAEGVLARRPLEPRVPALASPASAVTPHLLRSRLRSCSSCLWGPRRLASCRRDASTRASSPRALSAPRSPARRAMLHLHTPLRRRRPCSLSSASSAFGALSTLRADAPCRLPTRSITRPRRGVLARRPLEPRVPALASPASAVTPHLLRSRLRSRSSCPRSPRHPASRRRDALTCPSPPRALAAPRSPMRQARLHPRTPLSRHRPCPLFSSSSPSGATST